LRLHLDNEGTTEAIRQRLARRYNFNVHEAFTYLDVNRDGIISLDEVFFLYLFVNTKIC